MTADVRTKSLDRSFKQYFSMFDKIRKELAKRAKINLASSKNFQLSNFDSFSSRQKFRTKRSLLTKKTFCVVRVSSTEFLLVYFQVVRIPRKGSSAILQSMSISSSPLLFIVCSFLAIVSALTAATFLRTIQLLGGFTAQNNNGKKLENIKDRKDQKSVWNNWFIKG